MSFQEILECLKIVSPTSSDLIVLNGGEPTVHHDFYNILSKIQTLYSSEIAVYTNGTVLDIAQIHLKGNLSFIIPIHGTEQIHDRVVQIEGCYQKTLNSLNNLSNAGFRYRIKFILNDEMISNHFKIDEFLQLNNLFPEEIILARLNTTTKSKNNHVPMPTQVELKKYISSQIENIKNKHHIKFLDIPFCFLNSNAQTIQYTGNIPSFFFNDIENCMIHKNYYKDVMIGNNCTTCVHNKMCLIMKHSYLTLALDNNAFTIERE